LSNVDPVVTDVDAVFFGDFRHAQAIGRRHVAIDAPILQAAPRDVERIGKRRIAAELLDEQGEQQLVGGHALFIRPCLSRFKV